MSEPDNRVKCFRNNSEQWREQASTTPWIDKGWFLFLDGTRSNCGRIQDVSSKEKKTWFCCWFWLSAVSTLQIKSRETVLFQMCPRYTELGIDQLDHSPTASLLSQLVCFWSALLTSLLVDSLRVSSWLIFYHSGRPFSSMNYWPPPRQYFFKSPISKCRNTSAGSGMYVFLLQSFGNKENILIYGCWTLYGWSCLPSVSHWGAY